MYKYVKKIFTPMNGSNQNELFFIKSNRGGEICIFYKHVYNFVNKSETYHNWRCRIRTCPGRLRTRLEGDPSFTPHNHLACHDYYNNLLVKYNIKQATINTNYKTKEIFKQIVLEQNI